MEQNKKNDIQYIPISRALYQVAEEYCSRNNKELACDLLMDVLRYGFDGEMPDFANGDVMRKAFFLSVKESIDARIKSYLDGRKGGRPKKKKDSDDELGGTAVKVLIEK